MLGKEIRKTYYLIFAATGILTMLATWSLLSYAGLVRPFFLPTPDTVLSSLITLFKEGTLLPDILASFYRILLGFLLSLAISLPIGILLGISRKFEAVFEPLIAFIRYIPPSAFIPLAIIWFGIGETEKVAILFLGIAPYLSLLIADVIAKTKQELIEAALTLGANKIQIITKVVVPGALPGIWDSFRIMIGAAWTFVIIAEIVGASSGLGHLMIESQRFLRTDNIFAAIVIIGILGLISDYFFKVAYTIFFPWMEKTHA